MNNKKNILRVAHVDVNFGSGSTGTIVQSIHDQLKKRGHASHAFYGRGPFVKSNDVTKISSIFGTLIDVFMTRITGFSGVYSARSTKRLITAVRKFQPDVVHLHELHGHYLNYYKFVNYLDKKNIPIVWTLHCEYLYTGKCGYSLECKKWELACSACPQVSSYPKSWIFDRSNTQFYKKKRLFTSLQNVQFASVSNWLMDRYKRSFLKHQPVRVVYNGINTSVFFPRLLTKHQIVVEAKDKFICLSVAPDIMSERKGGRWIIELAKQFSNFPILFIMIGVDNFVADCPENVVQVGRIYDPVKLSEYYSIADILLLTSERETFSLVCVESLSCGTPVIGFASGGPAEVACEPFGQFAPYGDLKAIGDLLNRAFTNPGSLPSGDSCRDYAVSKFSVERMADQYLELYRTAIASGPNS